jgi:8-oxo-dGTP pyrophosphatase MutT (NUDIX family)
MDWQPHVTVATVIERNDQFLLVEERCHDGLVFNQPAGHLDPDETLQQAAVRETLEETGWHIELQGIVGIALYTSPHNNVTYNRTTFFAKAVAQEPNIELDHGIVRAVWMSYEDIQQNAHRMRSELVIKAIDQYRNGHRYPLALIYD